MGSGSSASSSNERTLSKENLAAHKRKFIDTVRIGDILVTGRALGHAAMMCSDDYVIEMRGGDGWKNGLNDNNRKVRKDEWFDEHAGYWTTVWRVKDENVARDAARWAYQNYYNPNEGPEKTKHISYDITHQFWCTDPSYCSKLVVQAFYYGTGNRFVIVGMHMLLALYILPGDVYRYFYPMYRPQIIGTF